MKSPGDRAYQHLPGWPKWAQRTLDGRCGAWAKSRKRPCEAPGSGRGGRCRVHGGASTGPKTAEGRERCRQAALGRWKRWRAERGDEQ